MSNILKIAVLLFALFFMASCEEEQPVIPSNIERTIWNGPKITFTKADNVDPNDAVNQDRLTDKVALTRGNTGGQIYNAISESSADKAKSPAGTEWAVGSIEEINTLRFEPFRSAVDSPQDIVGKDLILHLIEDDVYLAIKFTAWSAGRKGGFRYERSSSN